MVDDHVRSRASGWFAEMRRELREVEAHEARAGGPPPARMGRRHVLSYEELYRERGYVRLDGALAPRPVELHDDDEDEGDACAIRLAQAG